MKGAFQGTEYKPQGHVFPGYTRVITNYMSLGQPGYSMTAWINRWHLLIGEFTDDLWPLVNLLCLQREMKRLIYLTIHR